ncbi:hypothetical protein [Streptomyces sasae]|uniref:hypothetical protein n=1 Tax=Streptomyces sasae TaxID=1266772 RepID=UPI002931895B|nr:hypothetical protein [Streptomyces sasae]
MYVIHLWVRPDDCGQSWLSIDEAARVLARAEDSVVEHVYVPKEPLGERRGAIYLTATSAGAAGKAVLAAVEQLIQRSHAVFDVELRHPAAFGLCDGVVVVSSRLQPDKPT